MSKAWTQGAHPTEAKAEASFDLSAEIIVMQGQQHFDQTRVFGPDDRGTMPHCTGVIRRIHHGQHGEGTRWQEMFMGDAAMIVLVHDGADDRRLVIIELAAADSGKAAQSRTPAI